MHQHPAAAAIIAAYVEQSIMDFAETMRKYNPVKADRILAVLDTQPALPAPAVTDNTPPQQARGSKREAAAVPAKAPGPSDAAGVCGVDTRLGPCGGALNSKGECPKCAKRAYQAKWRNAGAKK